MHNFDRILLSAFEFDVHAVIKESRYCFSSICCIKFVSLVRHLFPDSFFVVVVVVFFYITFLYLKLEVQMIMIPNLESTDSMGTFSNVKTSENQNNQNFGIFLIYFTLVHCSSW